MLTAVSVVPVTVQAEALPELKSKVAVVLIPGAKIKSPSTTVGPAT